MSREPVSALSERLGLLHLQIGAELLGHLWLSRYEPGEVRALHAALNEHALNIREHAAKLESRMGDIFDERRGWAEREGATIEAAPYELHWLPERPAAPPTPATQPSALP